MQCNAAPQSAIYFPNFSSSHIAQSELCFENISGNLEGFERDYANGLLLSVVEYALELLGRVTTSGSAAGLLLPLL